MLEEYLKLAIDAHRGTSFTPDKRGRDLIDSYSEELKEDMKVKDVRYKELYVKKFTAWLSAKSRCMSSMITGPANFSVERNRRKNEIEHKRYEEFRKWREKQFREHRKEVDPIDSIKKTLSYFKDKTLSKSLLKASITGKLKRIAEKGDVETVKRGLELCEGVFTKRHQIWGYVELAERALQNQGGESTTKEYDGFKVVVDRDINRIQVIHDEKPDKNIINDLKSYRFNWSRKNGAWQRIITRNSVSATKALLRRWGEEF